MRETNEYARRGIDGGGGKVELWCMALLVLTLDVQISRLWRWSFSIEKNLVNPFVKGSRNFESQRQTRIVLAGFNGVDALTGHADSLGEVRLGPLLFGTANSKSGFHSNRLEEKNNPTLQRAIMSAGIQ